MNEKQIKSTFCKFSIASFLQYLNLKYHFIGPKTFSIARNAMPNFADLNRSLSEYSNWPF